MQSATGSGKTWTGSAVASQVARAGGRVLILVTRNRLVTQWHRTIAGFGVRAGVIAAEHPSLVNYAAQVQIASADTLHRRAVANQRMPLPSADVVIFDEAHFTAADTRVGLLEAYPEAFRVGFSATPARKSGRGLRQDFRCADSGAAGPRADRARCVGADENFRSAARDR